MYTVLPSHQTSQLQLIWTCDQRSGQGCTCILRMRSLETSSEQSELGRYG